MKSDYAMDKTQAPKDVGREVGVALIKAALEHGAELLQKGDVAGHEFHGNQYGGGSGGSHDYNAPSNAASELAVAATRKANLSGDKEEHAAAYRANIIAYNAHDEATRQARIAGNKPGEKAHAALAVEHFGRAQVHRQIAEKKINGLPRTIWH